MTNRKIKKAKKLQKIINDTIDEIHTAPFNSIQVGDVSDIVKLVVEHSGQGGVSEERVQELIDEAKVDTQLTGTTTTENIVVAKDSTVKTDISASGVSIIGDEGKLYSAISNSELLFSSEELNAENSINSALIQMRTKDSGEQANITASSVGLTGNDGYSAHLSPAGITTTGPNGQVNVEENLISVGDNDSHIDISTTGITKTTTSEGETTTKSVLWEGDVPSTGSVYRHYVELTAKRSSTNIQITLQLVFYSSDSTPITTDNWSTYASLLTKATGAMVYVDLSNNKMYPIWYIISTSSRIQFWYFDEYGATESTKKEIGSEFITDILDTVEQI